LHLGQLTDSPSLLSSFLETLNLAPHSSQAVVPIYLVESAVVMVAPSESVELKSPLAEKENESIGQILQVSSKVIARLQRED
jgi:hypothetical protein